MRRFLVALALVQHVPNSPVTAVVKIAPVAKPAGECPGTQIASICGDGQCQQERSTHLPSRGQCCWGGRGAGDVPIPLQSCNAASSLTCPSTPSSAFCQAENTCVNTCGGAWCPDEQQRPSSLSENEDTCPADCVTALVKSYNRLLACTGVTSLHFPTSVDSVLPLVQTPQLGNAASSEVKLKAIGKKGSVSQAICTDGMAISTENLNTIYGLESFEGETVVKVDAGVVMADLIAYLKVKEKALGYGLQGYDGATVAGAIATGSHGSSPKHSAVLASAVVSIELINGAGKRATYSKETTPTSTFKSLTVNAGLLGIVLTVRLAVRPEFNLDVNVTELDDTWLSDPLAQVSACDFAQMHWFPSTRKVIKVCGVETHSEAEAGARNMLLQPAPTAFTGQETIEPAMYNSLFQGGVCDRKVAAQLELERQQLLFQTYLMSGGTYVNTAIGSSSDMLTCPADPNVSYVRNIDLEVAIPQSKIAEALALAKQYLQHLFNASVWQIGVFLRFTKIEGTSWLANTAAGGMFKEGEVAMYFEMPITEPVAFTTEWSDWHIQPYKELMIQLIRKLGGRLHLGKNTAWAFDEQRAARNLGNNLVEFQKSVDELDMGGVFHNSFAAQLGLKQNQGYASGDVHLVGLDGGKFDVKGKHNKVYNLLSTESLTVNARFKYSSFVLPPSDARSLVVKSVHGSFLSAAYIAVRLQSGSDIQISYSGSTPFVASMQVKHGFETKQQLLQMPSSIQFENIHVTLTKASPVALTYEDGVWNISVYAATHRLQDGSIHLFFKSGGNMGAEELTCEPQWRNR